MSSRFFPVRVIVFCKNKIYSLGSLFLKKMDYPEGSMPLGSIKHKWITHLGGVEIDAYYPKKLFLSGKNKGYYLPKERMAANPLCAGDVYPRPDPNFWKGRDKTEYLNHKSKYTGFEYKVERWQVEGIMEKKYGAPDTLIISADSLHIPQFIAKPCGKYVKPFLKVMYANSIARVSVSVNKVLRKGCFAAALSLYLFEMLLILREGIVSAGINPYATTGAIFIDGERYFIPRDDLIVKMDQFLLLPFWIIYEVTEPFVEAPIFEQLTRFGNFEKVELVRNRRRNWLFYSKYLIVGGKRMRGPGVGNSGAVISKLKNAAIQWPRSFFSLVSYRNLCLFKWWI